MVIQDRKDLGRPVMHVAVPVILQDSQARWGTIRVCLSLGLMQQQIRQTRWTIGVLGVIALGAGILISNWTAQRVTRPLEKLAATTMDAAKQDLTLQISAGTRDEVEILASNFSFMIQEILAQKQKLEEQLQEIRRLQQYTEKVLVTMGDGLLAIDMEARVTTVNPAARRILELPVDHSIRLKPVWDLMDPESQMAGYVREVLADPSVEKQRELGSHTGKMNR